MNGMMHHVGSGGGLPLPKNLSDFSSYGESISFATNAQGFCFNSDYTKIWIIFPSTTNTIRQYNLSIAGDITTMVYESSFNAGNSGFRGIYANPNDEDIYVWDRLYGLRVYNLSTPNDITTASLNITNFYAEAVNRYGLFITPDGLKLLTSNSAADLVAQLIMTTPYDFSTMTFDDDYINTLTIRGGSFVNSGKSYLTSSSLAGSQRINQFNCSVSYDISTSEVTSSEFLDLSSSYGTGGVFSAIYSNSNMNLYFLRGNGKIYQLKA